MFLSSSNLERHLLKPILSAQFIIEQDDQIFFIIKNYILTPTTARLLTLVPELENLLKYGKKKFVRYEEGAKLYSMGLHSFQELAKEANAVYHVKRIVLVNTEVIDAYMENFKD